MKHETRKLTEKDLSVNVNAEQLQSTEKTMNQKQAYVKY